VPSGATSDQIDPRRLRRFVGAGGGFALVSGSSFCVIDFTIFLAFVRLGIWISIRCKVTINEISNKDMTPRTGKN